MELPCQLLPFRCSCSGCLRYFPEQSDLLEKLAPRRLRAAAVVRAARRTRRPKEA